MFISLFQALSGAADTQAGQECCRRSSFFKRFKYIARVYGGDKKSSRVSQKLYGRHEKGERKPEVLPFSLFHPDDGRQFLSLQGKDGVRFSGRPRDPFDPSVAQGNPVGTQVPAFSAGRRKAVCPALCFLLLKVRAALRQKGSWRRTDTLHVP